MLTGKKEKESDSKVFRARYRNSLFTFEALSLKNIFASLEEIMLLE
jgi:hypothetical protein